MAQKTVDVPGVGEVILSKRKGATNIRLSINAAGKIRVGMPTWTPYAAGIAFVKSKSDWILKNMQQTTPSVLKEGDLIGKAHRLHFVFEPDSKKISTRVTDSTVVITSGYLFNNPSVQAKAVAACEKALRSESEKLLPQRLESLAKQKGFRYKSVNIKKLTARWGSCSSKNVISLSYYLMQLPWHLIDYVLLHELTHTEHLHHGKSFWQRFTSAMPNARKLQKEIRKYRPIIKPYDSAL